MKGADAVEVVERLVDGRLSQRFQLEVHRRLRLLCRSQDDLIVIRVNTRGRSS